MNFKESTVENQSALTDVSQSSQSVPSLQYERLTTNSHVRISQFNRSYETINNDMWDEIFPQKKPITARQSKPDPVIGLFQQLSTQDGKSLHKSLPEINNTDRISDCQKLSKINIESIARASSVSVSNLVITPTAQANTHCVKPSVMKITEESYEDIWPEIFPIAIGKQQETKRTRPPRTETPQILFNSDKAEDKEDIISVSLSNITYQMTHDAVTLALTPSPEKELPYSFHFSNLYSGVGINSHCVLSDQKVNFDANQEIINHSSRVRGNSDEITGTLSAAGNEYDCISDVPYETTHEPLLVKDNKGNIHTITNRPLPVIPIDTYENFSFNSETTNTSQIVSRRSCFPITKVAVILATLITLVVMAVMVTTVVLNAGIDSIGGSDINHDDNRSNLRSFLDNPGLFGVIDDRARAITGLTVLDSQLFVVRHYSTEVNVYDTNNLTLIRNIPITGSSGLHAIVASPRHNCLYISSITQNVVYRYNLSDNVIINWSVGGWCQGLSLTSTHNLLVTLLSSMQIKEYTQNGSLVREISLDSSMAEPRYSAQLSRGQFVVCHGSGESIHRVCIVNASGHIIQCYGGFKGSGVEQLYMPTNLAVDGDDNVLVADHGNNRVVLLSPSLTHLGYLTIPGHTWSNPWALHFDLLTDLLYIGEYYTGRVFVLTA